MPWVINLSSTGASIKHFPAKQHIQILDSAKSVFAYQTPSSASELINQVVLRDFTS